MTISRAQCRAARAWLGWTQVELAEQAHVGQSTIRDFEAGRRNLSSESADLVEEKLKAAGITLLFDRTGRATGIRGPVDVVPVTRIRSRYDTQFHRRS